MNEKVAIFWYGNLVYVALSMRNAAALNFVFAFEKQTHWWYGSFVGVSWAALFWRLHRVSVHSFNPQGFFIRWAFGLSECYCLPVFLSHYSNVFSLNTTGLIKVIIRESLWISNAPMLLKADYFIVVCVVLLPWYDAHVDGLTTSWNA